MSYRLLLLLFLAKTFLYAETGFDVQINPSSSQLSIQENLLVHLKMTYPEGYHVNEEALRQNILRGSSFYEHPFALEDLKSEDPQKVENGSYLQRWKMTLRPLRMGDVSLVFYDFIFDPQNPQKQQIISIPGDIFPIRITSVEMPREFEGTLAPLLAFAKEFPLELSEENRQQSLLAQKNQQRVNQQQIRQKQLPWIFVMTCLLLVFILWFFLKHPVGKPTATPHQRAEEARNTALLQLDQLKKQKLLDRGLFDEFYVKLTQAVRSYIQQIYQIPASTRTTPEFLGEVAHNPLFPEEIREPLKRFLTEADQVKFGRYQPKQTEMDQAQTLAVHFIQTSYRLLFKTQKS